MSKQVEIKVASYTDDVDAAVKIFKQYWAGTMIFATYLQNIYTPEMVAMNGAIMGDDVIKNRHVLPVIPTCMRSSHNGSSMRALIGFTFILQARTRSSSLRATGWMCFRSSGKGTIRDCSHCIKMDT